MKYNDDYAACKATYATQRIYSGELDSDKVTRILGVKPTTFQRQGAIRNPAFKTQDLVKLNGWSFSSKDQIESRDIRRPLDWNLDQFKNSKEAFQQLRDAWMCHATGYRPQAMEALPFDHLKCTS